MCQADTTALTMKWDPDLPRPVDNLSSPHECVNWERLMEWVIPNSVDVFADGMLVHPTLGILTLNVARISLPASASCSLSLPLIFTSVFE